VEALVDAEGVSGLAHLHEPGMPVRADFTVTSTGKVRVSAVSNVASLSDVPRLEQSVRGYAVAKLEGVYDAGEIDATMEIDAGNLARGGFRLGSAKVTTHTWGKLDALRTDTVVRGAGVNLSGARWKSALLRVHGPVQTPAMRLRLDRDTMPDVTAEAGLRLGPRLAARGAKVEIDPNGEKVEVRSDLVELRRGVVDLGAVAIDGLGEPIDAIARVGANGFDVRVVSDGIDLDKLSFLANLPGPRLTGKAELDVDLRNVRDESRGCVRVEVRNGAVPAAKDIDMSFRASFAGRHVEVDTALSVGGKREGTSTPPGSTGVCLPARAVREEGVAELRASASLALGGSPLEISSWKDVTGTARLVRMLVDLDWVDQAVLGPLRIAESVGALDSVPSLGGTVELNGDIVRARPDAPPAWSLGASTKALHVGGVGSGERKDIRGLDLFGSASMHEGGLLQASMCVRDDMGAFDTEPCDASEDNVLASASVNAELDYRWLLQHPDQLRRVLNDARVDGRIVVHDRPVAALLRPLPLDPLPVNADRARAVVAVRGSLPAPRVDFALQLARLGPQDPGWASPATVCAQGQYDGERAWVHTELRRRAAGDPPDLARFCALSPAQVENSLGYVDADLRLAWEDALVWPSVRKLPWEANVNAVIHDFELSSIPELADHRISGRARMSGGIKGLGTHPEFDLQFGVENFQSGPGVAYDHGRFRVHTDASGLDGSLSFEDIDDDGKPASRLAMHVKTEQVRWLDGFEPTREESKPVHIEATANRFKVGMLTPFMQPVLSYVDGKLTGTARATWSPEQGESHIDELSFYLDEGAFQIPFIGQEFLEVKGMLQASQSDRIFVEHFRAQSLTGALQGRATIDLDDLDIERVDASLWTPRNDKIRLTFQGIPVGDFYGTIHATVEPKRDRNDVVLAFDRAHVDLPKTDLRSVQQLDANPDITVVPRIRGQGEGPGASDPRGTTPWVVLLETKNPAVLARSDLNVSVVTPTDPSEQPVLVYPDPKTGEASLRGHLLLYDGRVDVVGNLFYFEENDARVIFDGDPGNPKLSVTAQ